MAQEKLDPPSEEDFEREPTWRERLSDWLSKAQFITTTLLVVLLLGLGFLWSRMFITIQPGHLGVLYRRIGGGTVTDRVWSEGLHVIAPWNSLTPYEIRLQQQEVEFTVLSEEGLSLEVTASVRYHLRPDMLGYLHQDIGPEYYERLIKPEVHAHIRRTFGTRPAHEIYGSARDLLQEFAHVPLMGKVVDGGDRPRAYVDVEELKLMDIGLPELVQASIAEKYRQEQLMLEYKFKLEREEKEAERKRTEAAGIRDYNLIADKIAPDLLRWRGIEAMSELAKSPSSKVVVLGGGAGGVPLILNLPDTPAGAPAATSTTSATPVAAAAPAPVASAVTSATPAVSSTATAVASAAASTSAAPATSAVSAATASAAPATFASSAPTGSSASIAKGKAAP